MERLKFFSKLRKKTRALLDPIPDDKKVESFDYPTNMYWISLERQALDIIDSFYQNHPGEERLSYADSSLTTMALMTELAQTQQAPQGANTQATLEKNQERISDFVQTCFGGNLKEGKIILNCAVLRAKNLLNDHLYDTLVQEQQWHRMPTPIKRIS